MNITPEINWHDGYGNSPSLNLHIDVDIDPMDVTFEQKGNYFIGVHDTYQWLYKIALEGGPTSRGSFSPLCKMKDGTHHQVVGGWLSNRGKFKEDLGFDLFEVTIYMPGWNGTGMFGYLITKEKLDELLATNEFDRPVSLIWDESFNWWDIKKVEKPSVSAPAKYETSPQQAYDNAGWPDGPLVGTGIKCICCGDNACYYTNAGAREIQISRMCEPCFDFNTWPSDEPSPMWMFGVKYTQEFIDHQKKGG